mgnify:CR=1 FL=1
MNFSIDPNYCAWDTESTLLIFSNNVFGDFIYYTHLLPVVAVLIFTILLLFQSHRDPAIISLSVISLAFILWSFSDLVLWATANPNYTMFFWSIIIHFELLIYIASLYFFHHYLYNKSLNLWVQYLLVLAYLPIVFFAHTKLNLVAYDYTNCNREAIEGSLVLYVYFLEIIISIYILVLGFKKYFYSSTGKNEIILLTLGLGLFLIAFSSGNIVGTLQINWEVGQYGLLSVPLFMGLLTYLIVRYRSFNVKVLGSEALVIGITILITSILFVRTIENVRVITIFTIIMSFGLGYILIRSVHKEIKQREQIQQLANSLEKANTRLRQIDKLKSEFVSIASHQLRSPLTSIRGYASLIREGSYGPISPKLKEPIERIEASAAMMAESIEDYLSVSRIESGNMKYQLSDFNLASEAEHIADDLRSEALKRGLMLLYKKKLSGSGIVNADLGKTQQIIHNLLNNSLKYTVKGTITVMVIDDLKKKQISVEIIDTGIGMNDETLNSIFQKFERGDKANSVNVKGTGLGLYVAERMADAMGGSITAHSEGEGKGSRFVFTLPLTH